MASAQAFFPISEISTYHSKWTIRARVTSKGNLRTFPSRSGGNPTQVFDLYILDESGGEIRANFFGAMAEKYYGIVEQGKCYTFARGSVRIANRQFNRCNHRYELVFDRDGLVEAADDDAKISAVKFSFVDFRAVQSKAVPCTVDLCGVVTSFKPTFSFTSRDGKELVKRDITLADDTATSLNVALWGERAQQADSVFEGNPIVCLKGVGIKEWQGGRAGSLMESGVMQLGSDLPDALRLKKWWEAEGSSTSLTSLSLSQDGLVDLRTLQSKAVPCTVELVGAVVNFKPTFSFTSKDGKELTKREITIGDHTGMSMSITLWGDRAKQDDSCFANNPVIGIRGVVVKEWNGGRSGSLLEAGSLVLNPTTAESQKVREWWASGGSTQSLTQLSQDGPGGGGGGAISTNINTIADMRRAADNVGSSPEMYSIVCRLALVQTKKQGDVQPLSYKACQEPKAGSSLPCNRRVGEDGFCAACDRVGKAAPRLNLRCRFSDATDSAWLTTFHDAAQKVLRMSAAKVVEIEDQQGRDSLEAMIRQMYFDTPFHITVRAKLDTYQGEARANTCCLDARPVSRTAYGRTMVGEIKDMLAKSSELVVV